MSHKLHGRAATRLPVYPIPFDGAASGLPSKEAAGSKAYNLMVMAQYGLPVPPGFVLGTQVCRNYLEHGRHALDGLEDVLEAQLDRVGNLMGRHFGDAKHPFSFRFAPVLRSPCLA
ncbi:MAG: PEP/pyruvate-binding domain-containing protein [Hyphomicrobiaceae bacterium]